jgi:GalNAc-alpha-(1->4)-GalNAc-alpha-(1->3)-diNAcBac-PP-undecaprenol alpha-1,4-N-acetyl-D-galactosaminyltransferase
MMKKIMILNYSLALGGTDRVAVELAKIFQQEKYAVSFVSVKKVEEDFFPLPPGVQRTDLGFIADDSSVRGAGYVGFSASRSLFRFFCLLLAERPDYVVANWTSINCFALIACFFSRTKCVCVEHIHFDQPSRFWALLRRLLYRAAFKIVCLTSDDLREYRRLGLDAVQIMNPLTVEAGKLSRREGKVFVAVGRLELQKGFDLLIKAFTLVAKQHSGALLRIYGSGSQEHELVRLIDSLGLAERVSLCGATKDISSAYSQSDFFVLSSRYEGFGLVIAEAQAHGLPVVSFDCPRGPSEIIRNRENGLLVENGSIDALANAMLELLNDRQLCDYMVDNALKDIARFSHSAIYDEWSKKVFGAPK